MEQVAGRVKQGVGETLGNQKLANQGVADQVKGAAKETWGNAKDAADVQRIATKRKRNKSRRCSSRVGKRSTKSVKRNEKIDAHKARNGRRTGRRNQAHF